MSANTEVWLFHFRAY